MLPQPDGGNQRLSLAAHAFQVVGHAHAHGREVAARFGRTTVGRLPTVIDAVLAHRIQ